MKKIILLLALILSIKNIAQNNATVTIVNVTPTLVCPGDTITIKIKFIAPVPSNTNLPVWFYLWKNHTFEYTNIWTANYNAFYSLPKIYVAPDTIYSLKVKTPSVFHGDSVKVTIGQSFKYINFCANVTGIHELQNSADRSIPIYYDMQGKPIQNPYNEQRYNEMIIERKGIAPNYTYSKLLIKP